MRLCRPQGSYVRQLPLSSSWRTGGSPPFQSNGGRGATVEATVFLQQGVVVPIIVGGQGTNPQAGSEGGGGLSAVYTNIAGALPTIVAGMVMSFGAVSIGLTLALDRNGEQVIAP